MSIYPIAVCKNSFPLILGSLALGTVVTGLSAGLLLSPILSAEAQAGQNGFYVSGSRATHFGNRQYYTRSYNGRRHARRNRYNGPLIININEALAQKGRLRGAPNPNRHVIEGIGGARVLYYDQSHCDNGYDCTIRLGDEPSSPKIVIIGEKRKIDEESGPHIILPAIIIT